MRYDLAGLVRRARNIRRRQIVIRDVILPEMRAVDLHQQVYGPIVAAWEQVIPQIIEAYDRNLPVTDGQFHDDVNDLQSLLDRAAEAILRLVVDLRLSLSQWTLRNEAFQRQRWVDAVKAATGVDLATFLGPNDVDVELKAFIERNVALMKDINSQARGRIAEAVFRSASERTGSAELAKEIGGIVDMSRKRARRIASDQKNKLGAFLNRARQQEAGLDRFRWRHSGKLHPRLHHKARDGKIYLWNNNQLDGDLPGMAPFCGCHAQGILVLK